MIKQLWLALFRVTRDTQELQTTPRACVIPAVHSEADCLLSIDGRRIHPDRRGQNDVRIFSGVRLFLCTNPPPPRKYHTGSTMKQQNSQSYSNVSNRYRGLRRCEMCGTRDALVMVFIYKFFTYTTM